MKTRLFSLLLLCGTLHAEVPTNGWTLVRNDEFDGTTLDTSKWGYWLTGARREAVNTPSAITNGDGTETVIFRDTIPRGATPRFIHLKITQP